MNNETPLVIDALKAEIENMRAAGILGWKSKATGHQVAALLDRIDRLTESNRKLANQIVGYGDRVRESVRSIQADAWDKGWDAGDDYGYDTAKQEDRGGPDPVKLTNPYRSTSETI